MEHDGARGATELGNTKSSSESAKKRVIQSKYWIFTWNNYGDDQVLEQLEQTFRPLCDKYAFQQETGESGTPHIQGMICLKTKMRWSQFNLPSQIHWEKMRGTPDEARAYCTKTETRTGRVVQYGWPAPLRLIEEFRPFQTTLLQMLMQEPDDRTILWIYDSAGRMGKTQFAKYMFATHKAICATGGRCEDMACILAMAKKEGRDLNSPFTFILNLPREQDPEKVSYKFLESIKDGFITSPKYESSTMVFNSPHVLVCANCLPIGSRVSSDRWKIFSISDTFDLYEYEGAF